MLYSFKKRCFVDLITNQYFLCPSLSTLRCALNKTDLRRVSGEAVSIAGALAQTLPHPGSV
jgi:hypothetical protein